MRWTNLLILSNLLRNMALTFSNVSSMAACSLPMLSRKKLEQYRKSKSNQTLKLGKESLKNNIKKTAAVVLNSKA